MIQLRSERRYSFLEDGLVPMGKLERAFWQHYEANPETYHAIFALIKQAHEMGYRRWSINAAFEVARYEYRRKNMTMTDSFKMNNNHRAFAARLFKSRYPDFASMLETRENKGRVS